MASRGIFARALASAEQEPVLIQRHGHPSLVMMSVEEFHRLKAAAGEDAPPEAQMPGIAAVEGEPIGDPLGQDTRDFWDCARRISEAALSGRNREASREEIRRVEQALGMAKDIG